MTVSNQEFSPDEELEFEEEEYPTLFGITLTPRNSGILCALIGVGASIYLLVSFIFPAQKSYQELKADRQAKEQQIQKLNPQKVARDLRNLETEIQQSKRLSRQVVSLFSQSQSINTLLLDINSFVKARGATLISFKPVNKSPSLIQDNSLGKAANKMFRRQTFTIEIEGTYQQVQSIIRDIERMQLLVLVNNFTSNPSKDKILLKFDREKNQAIPAEEVKLKSKFDVDILLPISGE